MTYMIAEPCIDLKDRSCVDECPVDCIYEGGRKLYIQPDECVDCGACEPVCPVTAIFYEDDVPPEWKSYIAIEAEFFTDAVSDRFAGRRRTGGRRRGRPPVRGGLPGSRVAASAPPTGHGRAVGCPLTATIGSMPGPGSPRDVRRPALPRLRGELLHQRERRRILVPGRDSTTPVPQRLAPDLLAAVGADDRERPAALLTQAAERDVGVLGGEVGAVQAPRPRPLLRFLQ